MPTLFWITFAVTLLTSLVGVITSLNLYEQIGGRARRGFRDIDLDRMVRESW